MFERIKQIVSGLFNLHHIFILVSEICNAVRIEDTPSTSYICNVLTLHDNMTEKIKFLQAAMGYSTKSILLLGVKKVISPLFLMALLSNKSTGILLH